MKILNYFGSLALSGLFSLATLKAEDWQTLLPNQTAAPEWSAGALMVDPYDISPTPGAFVGTFTETDGAATIHYVAPDGYTQSVDNNLARVFSLAESNGAIRFSQR